jgi:hypothetical protein
MTLTRTLLAVALLGAAAPAVAQLSNRSISVESGLSAPTRAGAPAAAAFALAATGWLDGDLEAVARVALWAGPRTAGRASDGTGWTGTAGLRLSLLPEPLRPQVTIEAGWARVDGPAGPSDRLALGASLGVEWFVIRDASVVARCGVRGAGTSPSVEVVVGAAAYF